MDKPLTPTREEWLAMAKWLLPGLTQEQRDDLWEDCQRAETALEWGRK